MDIDQRCRAHADERTAVLIADAGEPEDMVAVATLCRSADLIVDDGAHTDRTVLNAYRHLWPLVGVHGHYVIEDLDPTQDLAKWLIEREGFAIWPTAERVAPGHACLLVKEATG